MVGTRSAHESWMSLRQPHRLALAIPAPDRTVAGELDAAKPAIDAARRDAIELAVSTRWPSSVKRRRSSSSDRSSR